MFNQVRAHLERNFPSLEIHGGNFNPPPSRLLLSKLIQAAYMLGIITLLFGERIFPALGIPPPQLYLAARENKVSSLFCFVLFIGWHV